MNRVATFRTLIILITAGCSACHWAGGSDPMPEGEVFNGLAEAKRRIIWDVEHLSFEIEMRFGKRLVTALDQGDGARVAEIFAALPAIEVLDRANSVPMSHGVLNYVSREGRTLAASDIEFADYLLGYAASVERDRWMSFRVVDVQSLSRSAAGTETEFTASLSGTGLDSQGRPTSFKSMHNLSLRFHDESNLDSGGTVFRWNVESELFGRSLGPLMEEVTEQTNLNQIELHDNWTASIELTNQYNCQVAVDDFDRDGYLDIVVCCGDGPQYVLKSDCGKKFVDVTESLGIPARKPDSSKAFLATWIDHNNDGYPDLVLGDRFYENAEGKFFRDATQSSRLNFSNNPMGCAVADYDCDGRLDLYILYHHSDNAHLPSKRPWVADDLSGRQNELWRNEGNGAFRDVTEAVAAGGGNRQSFAAAWIYLGDDRYPDLYIANDFGTNGLLEYRGDGLFRDMSEALGVADFSTSMGVAAGDVDGDGETEIYVANMYSTVGSRIIKHLSDKDYPPGVFTQIQGSSTGSCFYHRKAKMGPFLEVSKAWGINAVGWAHAPALVDLDADGFLDIYATTGFMSFHRGKPDG